MAIKPVESGDINPRVVVFDAEGNTKGSYTIPFGAYLMVREGEEIKKDKSLLRSLKREPEQKISLEVFQEFKSYLKLETLKVKQCLLR